ncbi:hypothetical protein QFC24_003574 [Naganishia onofrii]|uniref:Uncharacterized protein n=1 Tax=Naganishia onofrii TaxID=1851511 RepID=A0ACC2XJI7_9TREE|nr:hypothetical protein QFC24_003574 [Naganishia onofrii]
MRGRTEEAVLESGPLPVSMEIKQIDQDGKYDVATLPNDEDIGEEVSKNAFLSKRTEAIMMTAICTALFVSLIFILNFCGFTSAAVLNVWLTDRLGFGMVILGGAIIQGVSFALVCWAPPFGLFVFAMYLNGLGTGLQDAQANGVITRFSNSDAKMQYIHAAYDKSTAAY